MEKINAEKKRPTILRKKQVCEFLRMDQNTVDDFVKEGAFPKPIKIGPGKRGTPAWIESEIIEWLDKLIAERDAKGVKS